MMSKKQWFALLCLYVIYMLVGAAIFFNIESREEIEKIKEGIRQTQEIENLLNKHCTYGEETHDDIFERLSNYCGKPMTINETDTAIQYKWDYYYSVFFVITVVSTIGYGNLAPTTMQSRIFMIFYALIGIPINGIVMVTLGDFFGKSFTKLYHRWKTSKMQYDTARLGLIGQIALYLVPGFTFFIFLPSVIISVMEGWDYEVAVYYSFVTLTTIGFGDYVAGLEINGFPEGAFIVYKIFLLVWIIIGLGYVVMILGFITRGMQSKKMRALEQIIANNIKRTPHKLRKELRSLLHEILLMRVKRVYKGEFDYTPTKRDRSQSCPDLTLYRNMNSPTMMRKRALSECPCQYEMSRVQSDTDLERIDKEQTFKPAQALAEQSDLLFRVVNALGNYEGSTSSDSDYEGGGIDGFPESEILANEKYSSGWTLGSQALSSLPPRILRQRACSEIKLPFSEKIEKNADMTWYGPQATQKLQELRERVKHGKSRGISLPLQTSQSQSLSLLTRLKNTFKSQKTEEKPKNIDIERQDYYSRPIYGRDIVDRDRNTRKTSKGRNSIFSVPDDPVLEQTSIADFLRALTAISVPESASNQQPKRKLGTASLTPPKPSSPPKTRRIAICPKSQTRKFSLMPTHHTEAGRRFSLRPAIDEQFLPSKKRRSGDDLTPSFEKINIKENTMLEPPPYTVSERMSFRAPFSQRRYSLRRGSLLNTPSTAQRHLKLNRESDNKESHT